MLFCWLWYFLRTSKNHQIKIKSGASDVISGRNDLLWHRKIRFSMHGDHFLTRFWFSWSGHPGCEFRRGGGGGVSPPSPLTPKQFSHAGSADFSVFCVAFVSREGGTNTKKHGQESATRKGGEWPRWGLWIWKHNHNPHPKSSKISIKNSSKNRFKTHLTVIPTLPTTDKSRSSLLCQAWMYAWFALAALHEIYLGAIGKNAKSVKQNSLWQFLIDFPKRLSDRLS